MNGASNTGQFINRYMCAIIQMEYAPNLNSYYDMLPVDSIATQIRELAKFDHIHKVYHLINMTNLITINTLTKYINSFGYNIKIIPFDDWRDKLYEQTKELHSDNRLSPLLSMFEHGFPSTSPINDLQTVQTLNQINLQHPIIDENIIHKYLSYFIRCGLIPPPSSSQIKK